VCLNQQRVFSGSEAIVPVPSPWEGSRSEIWEVILHLRPVTSQLCFHNYLLAFFTSTSLTVSAESQNFQVTEDATEIWTVLRSLKKGDVATHTA
jgi:hypothetical protein